MAILMEFMLPTVVSIAIGIGCVQWVCWIFKVGRFSQKPSPKIETPNNPLRYMIANFFVNIINDFRHLLALFIVSIFAITLFVSLYKTPWNDTDKIINVMQAVSSTFGGLIGAIIGFYFGEKTGRSKNITNDEFIKASEIEEQEELVKNEVKKVIIPVDPPETAEDKS